MSPIEGVGVPPREGAQDALPEGEQRRQHQAAAGGGGVVPLLAPGVPTAAEREPDMKSITVRIKPGADHV